MNGFRNHRRRLRHDRSNKPYKYAREQTSSGQSQALWTFLIAIAVSAAAVFGGSSWLARNKAATPERTPAFSTPAAKIDALNIEPALTPSTPLPVAPQDELLNKLHELKNKQVSKLEETPTTADPSLN